MKPAANPRKIPITRHLSAAESLASLDSHRLTLPVFRGRCKGQEGCCPLARCRYTLLAEPLPDGSLKLYHPNKDIDDLIATCALDEADKGGLKQEEVADRMGYTRQRAEQIEIEAIAKIAKALGETPQKIREVLAEMGKPRDVQ